MLRGQRVSPGKSVQGSRARFCIWSDPQFSLVGSDPTDLPWDMVSLFGITGTMLVPGPWGPFVLCAACCHNERDEAGRACSLPLASSLSSGTLLPCLGGG